MTTIYACSTKNNGVLNRTYHNTTARYNGYFNAKESVLEGKETLKKAHVDNYDEVLPIFIYGTESSARSIYPQMDRSIEKCSKVINNHSMYIKKKEYCKWIDDSYLLIGVSHFYKREYDRAIEILNYVEKEFEKYEDHAIIYDARLWLARTNIEKKDYAKAASYISLCEKDKEFPEKKKAELKVIKADFYLKKGDDNEAIEALKKAISLTKRKKMKRRLSFILAQVYQKQGNANKAVNFYAQVLKLNPEYEMEFYANINSALSHAGGNSALIKKELFKMLKDDKYDEFYDQIYYALAELELKENNTPKGIEYLELSYQNSESNDKQKAKTYSRLANLYFENNQYVNAQAYFDSTVNTMDKTALNYGEVLETRNSLTLLVKDINTVSREDSLQRLAALPRREQEKIIDEIIQEIVEAEELKKQEAENAILALQNAPTTQTTPGTRSREWYFYNPQTISFGDKEFKKRWGNIKLEDNWRRKDKSSMADVSFDDFGDLESLDDTDTNATANDLKSPRYYFKNIPDSKKKIKASNNKIIDALYDMGIVYKEKLNDNSKAIEAFEDLVTRYDTSKFHLSSYYQLYRLYLTKGNTSKSDFYKNIILTDYADSKYARLIQDPNYLENEKKKLTIVSDFYKKTYSAYKNKNYAQVIDNANTADDLYFDNAILHKFHYLRAQAIGATDSVEIYQSMLEKFVKDYPDKPETAIANQTLKIIKHGNKPPEEKEDEDKVKYVFKADTKHFFIVIFSNTGIDISKAKIEIADFNRKFYRSNKLKISSSLLEDKRLIIVKSYSNVFKGMDYYNSFTENTKELKKVSKNIYDTFIITPKNFGEFFKNKDIDGYKTFFEENYK